ncbi:retrovirus-related pol polyprotein from transposon TNT 1-94, partial [Tanacetum coccineum]
TMANMNIPADDVPAKQAPAIAPPIRTDDQILPSRNWVPVGKSNCVLDVLKPQKSPIFQFWDTMRYDSTTRMYRCQLDEQCDAVIEYVNTLGYPCTLKNVSAMSVNSLYQPWRAILSMINMCLTGKTAGYDRLRHPVLQILWGKSLTTAARGKKKSTPLLIPSIRFTKLIIYYLKTKHNIHPRTNSPLHYSHDDIVLGTVRSIGKDGREISGMPIPDALLTDEIKRAPYYNKYLEHVAKYQQYLDEERGKAEEGGVTESPKAVKQTKPSTPKAAKETPDEPSPAKRSKGGLVGKRRKSKSPLKLVDEPIDKCVPVEEPAYNEEEENLQQALELSLKDQGERTHGPACPVVIWEPDSGRIQPLLDVQGKGKEKVVDEQAAHDLLTLQTPKKKSPTDQFIFQRCTPMPTEPSGHAESPSLDVELALTDSETESDEEVPPVNPEKDASYKELAKINTGDQDEGQAGPNPGKQDEGQVGSNPGKAAVFQAQSSHVFHAGPNLEHMDIQITDASTQQNPEKMGEEFTTTAYPNVQENLKLPTKDLFFVEKPHEEEPEKNNTESEIQSMVIVPIYQHTSSVPPMTTPVIDLSVSHPVSTTVSKAVDEIVTDVVDWAMQAPLRARFSDLPAVDIKEILQQRMFEDKSYKAHEDHKNLFEALQKSLECDYSNQLLADLDEARKKKRKRHESPKTPPGSLPLQPPPPPPPAGASGAPGTSRASGSSQSPPPPPPPSIETNQGKQQQGSGAPSSSVASTPQSMAWTTFDTRYELAVLVVTQESSPTDDLMNEGSILDEQIILSDDEDSGNDHLPKADMRKDWWKPLLEEERPTTPEPAWTIPSSNMSYVENNWASALVSTYEPPAENSLLAKIEDMTTFMNWYCQKVNKTVLTQVDFERQAYEVVKAFYPDVIHLQFQMEECHKMLADQINWANLEDLEYLRYGNKGSRLALSISKMKE